MQFPKGLQITFLGHASFHIVTPGGKVVLIDPWLRENPACPPALRQQDRADLILITHGHGDHLDEELIPLAQTTGATVVAPSAIHRFLAQRGLATLEAMGMGGTLAVHGLKVTMTQAFHSAHISYLASEADPAPFPHDTVGYVLRTEDDFAIYHAGDTAVFGDMRLIGELYRPAVALLPIGDRFTMGPTEAAYAARLLGAPCVIPMHYGTFPFLTGTPEAFQAAARDIPGLTVRVMQPGEVVSAERP
jgi:L-ascorbate metabolism protein UlaG (beta-lactamase superfamily)